MADCVFCKIVAKKSPAEVVFEDDSLMVFPDTDPSAPVHLLIIPKQHIPDLESLDNPELLGHIFDVAKQIYTDHGGAAGYRLAINSRGLADVGHAHFHLWSGPTKEAVFRGGDTK